MAKYIIALCILFLSLSSFAQVTYIGKTETFFRNTFKGCSFISGNYTISAFDCEVLYAAFDSNGICTYYTLIEGISYLDALRCTLEGMTKKYYTNSSNREVARYFGSDIFIDVEKSSTNKGMFYYITFSKKEHDGGGYIYRDFSAEKWLTK
jgi:hypothetical protein